MSIEPKANTIAEQWEAFSDAIIPKDAPPEQWTDMRRAFYAGFEASLRIQWSMGDKKISEIAAMAMLQGLYEECALFASDVVKGKA